MVRGDWRQVGCGRDASVGRNAHQANSQGQFRFEFCCGFSGGCFLF